MSAPKRIQLSRKKGWRKPEGAVVVARPSRWGNPFKIRGANDMWVTYDDRTGKVLSFQNSKPEALAAAVRCYEVDLVAGLLPFTTRNVEQELAAHDLCCWCPLDQPCHADVLLELANGSEPRQRAALTNIVRQGETLGLEY